MAKAIHSMIRVLDEARSVDFYRRAFGLDVAQRLDFPDFTLVYLSNPETDFELELTVNKGRTEPYQLGDGYGHLAFSVDDLDAGTFTDDKVPLHQRGPRDHGGGGGAGGKQDPAAIGQAFHCGPQSAW